MMGINKISISILMLFVMNMVNSEILLEENIDYYTIESSIIEETEFIESSVMIKYQTETKKDIEKNRIADLYKDDYEICVQDNLALKGDCVIEFNIWEENNTTFVEGIIESKNLKTNSRELKKELQKLQNSNMQNTNYFNYYKGKIIKNNIDELSLELKGESIKIENGYTGKVMLGDGTRLNYSLMEYNTGLYLIIGTPIIFKTY